MDAKPTEYDLALQARDGDPEALAELVERTRVRLFSLAYAELRHYNDAQDAVAAALLQICLHMADLSTRDVAQRVGHPEGTVPSWLHRGRRHLAARLDQVTLTSNRAWWGCAAPVRRGKQGAAAAV
jgi:DNA-directed RNA polymerase specialized sigma24 family protein